jgi:hypothetical protein
MTMMTTNDSALVEVLTNLGVEVRNTDGREIQGRCPVHLNRTGKEDRSPSWSMNASTGLWICFSCGARGSLPMLVEELTGDHSSLITVHTMLIDAGINQINQSLSPASPREEGLLSTDLVTFAKFSVPPKAELRRRNLTSEALEEYSVRWDSERDAWVLPILSSVGEMLGWQLKGSGWVRNYPKGVKASRSLFGMHRLNSATTVVVESPLDVVRFAGVFSRPKAIATFGATVSDYQIRTISEIADRVVLAMDNDVAGWKSMRRMFTDMPALRKGLWFFDYNERPGKDIGEMSDNDIAEGVSCASLLPPWSVDVSRLAVPLPAGSD